MRLHEITKNSPISKQLQHKLITGHNYTWDYVMDALARGLPVSDIIATINDLKIKFPEHIVLYDNLIDFLRTL